MGRKAVAVVFMGLGWALGCDGVDAVEDGARFRSEVDNGVQLNSAALNGVQLNGVQLNGVQLNGVQLNGVQLNGVQLNGVQLNGSTFTGSLGSVVKTGAEFVGAQLQLVRSGVSYTLRFDSITRASPTDDVWFYGISVREGTAGAWSSLCKDSSGAAVAAIPIPNSWNTTTGARVDDPGVVTFACRGAALAKCVEWGYAPWHTAQQCNNQGSGCATISLKDHHQACTRMVRADYCGNGTSYTFDGTPIDVYDKLQTRLQTRTTLGNNDWAPEAEWGPNGATCVGDELRMQMYDERSVAYTLPTCLDAVDDFNNCGTLASTRPGSLVADAYCYKWTTTPGVCAAVDNDNKRP